MNHHLSAASAVRLQRALDLKEQAAKTESPAEKSELLRRGVIQAKQVMITTGDLEDPETKIPEGWTRGHDTHALCYKCAPSLKAFVEYAKSLEGVVASAEVMEY